MAVHVVDDPATLQLLAHPLRLRVLEALREPGSAAAAARAVGESRQKVNYHLKELERAGLVRSVGERRVGNFVEMLYESVAEAITVSPRLAWGAQQRAALAGQVSLEQLVAHGERIQLDAADLLDRAAFDGAEIASASVDAEVRFPDEAARSAFMQDYLEMLGPLLRKHGARRGDTYRVLLAVYPEPGGS